MSRSPEPHPLDYDWRFTNDTVEYLAKLAPQHGETLILGAPSVARFLQGSGQHVTLVDRQPLQGVANQIARDPATFDLPSRGFAAAILDPPWYPNCWRLWIAWVARTIGLDRDILASIWPAETRPSAESELARIYQWLLGWSEVERLPSVVRYQTPIFEQAAICASRDKRLAASPGVGHLLRIRATNIPPPEPPVEQRSTWRRFVINDYQLALRCEPSTGDAPSIRRLGEAQHWVWPFVSERAPERNLIGLWSSRNEVAVVSGSSTLASWITAAIKSTTAEQFEKTLERFGALALLEWQMPRPPYWRILEWHHPQ